MPVKATSDEKQTMKQRRPKAEASGESVPGIKPWHATRTEKVVQARRLIQDKNYPSKEILDSVANLMAKKLKRSK